MKTRTIYVKPEDQKIFEWAKEQRGSLSNLIAVGLHQMKRADDFNKAKTRRKNASNK